MKLIIAILKDSITSKVIKSLTKYNYRTTKLSSTGGFLKSGNTTLLIGVEDEKVDQAIKLIENECKDEKHQDKKDEINESGANIFILNMDKYKRI